MDTENKTYPKLSKAMASAGAEFPRELERSFQRILGRIEFLWGEKEAIKYLDSLLLEDRKGRKGFPMEVIGEIAQVKQVHDFLYPTLDITPFDPFSASGILPRLNINALPGPNLKRHRFKISKPAISGRRLLRQPHPRKLKKWRGSAIPKRTISAESPSGL